MDEITYVLIVAIGAAGKFANLYHEKQKARLYAQRLEREDIEALERANNLLFGGKVGEAYQLAKVLSDSKFEKVRGGARMILRGVESVFLGDVVRDIDVFFKEEYAPGLEVDLEAGLAFVSEDSLSLELISPTYRKYFLGFGREDTF